MSENKPSVSVVLLCLLGFLVANNSGAETQAIADIQTQVLGDLMVSKTRRVPAIVVSDNDAMIKAEISAVVEELLVKPGQTVVAGQPILAFDCADYVFSRELAEADLSSAEADLKFSKLQYTRTKDLKTKSLAATQELDSTEAQFASMRAKRQRAAVVLKQAQRNVDRCAISAPFAGVVMEKFASVGELLSQGADVIRLVDTDNLELSASISPAYREELSGQRKAIHLQRQTFP